MANQLDASGQAFVAGARVARLATSDAAGDPYLVTVCYAWDGERAYIPLDAKPKGVEPSQLKRVRNILARPTAALLVDYYDDAHWERLAFVQLRGPAALVAPGMAEHIAAVTMLKEKYPQYRQMPIEERPVICLTAQHSHQWQYDPALPLPGRANDWAAIIRGRRSVRSYQDRLLTRPQLEAILAAGGYAPSPHGRQPWRFVVLTTAEAKRTLADAMAAEWQRNLEMDGQAAEIVNIRLSKSYQRILGAPAIIIPCLYLTGLDVYPDTGRQAAEATMAVQSLGAAAQNMLLAAYALGLDGGWMCAPLFCPEVVVVALGLDPRLTPHAMLTFGYAAADPKRRPKLPLGDLVVRWT